MTGSFITRTGALALAVFISASAAQAGSATVTLGGQQYGFTDITCASGEGWFKLQGKASSGAGPMELAAVGGEVNSVGFRAGDTMAQVVDKTGTFNGSAFSYEGEAQVYTLNSINRQTLRVSIDCSQG